MPNTTLPDPYGRGCFILHENVDSLPTGLLRAASAEREFPGHAASGSTTSGLALALAKTKDGATELHAILNSRRPRTDAATFLASDEAASLRAAGYTLRVGVRSGAKYVLVGDEPNVRAV